VPLYEYKCANGHRFEAFRPMGRRHDPIRCDKCRAVARLLMSVASASFGWRLKDACHEIGGPRDEFEKDL
jgi:putative FmdB family regulatory protein